MKFRIEPSNGPWQCVDVFPVDQPSQKVLTLSTFMYELDLNLREHGLGGPSVKEPTLPGRARRNGTVRLVKIGGWRADEHDDGVEIVCRWPELTVDLVRTILAEYHLLEPDQIELIHNPTNITPGEDTNHPTRETGRSQCPKHGETDSTSLVAGDHRVTWCACGCVLASTAQQTKRVHDFFTNHPDPAAILPVPA